MISTQYRKDLRSTARSYNLQRHTDTYFLTHFVFSCFFRVFNFLLLILYVGLWLVLFLRVMFSRMWLPTV